MLTAATAIRAEGLRTWIIVRQTALSRPGNACVSHRIKNQLRSTASCANQSVNRALMLAVSDEPTVTYDYPGACWSNETAKCDKGTRYGEGASITAGHADRDRRRVARGRSGNPAIGLDVGRPHTGRGAPRSFEACASTGGSSGARALALSQAAATGRGAP